MSATNETTQARSGRVLTNETTQAILKYLFNAGIFAWRQNTAGIPLASGGFRPAAMSGISDILAVLPTSGRFLAIEVKTGRDRLRPEQVGFIRNVTNMGGVALVVKDFEDFKNQFERLSLTT